MKNRYIILSKYLLFSKEIGNFRITTEAEEILRRKVHHIETYYKEYDWVNHFVCELIDLYYCGGSTCKYSLGTVIHEVEIPKIWKHNKEDVINWVLEIQNCNWGKKVFEIFDMIIDNMPIDN